MCDDRVTLSIPSPDAIEAQVSPAHVKGLDQALKSIWHQMRAEQDLGLDVLEKRWRAWTVSHKQEHTIRDVVKLAEAARGEFDTLLLLGIGGSDLAPRLINEVLDDPLHNSEKTDRAGGLEVHFGGDTFDVRRLRATLRDLKARGRLPKTLANVVSRSGKTAETFAAMMLTRDALMDAGVRNWEKHVVATTGQNEGSLLFSRNGGAKGDVFFGMLPVPVGVGGRYSAASPVGLFPLALSAGGCGPEARVRAAMDGYGRGHEQAFDLEPSDEGNVAFQLAKWLHLAERYAGKSTLLLYNYADDRYLGDWFTQLYSESIQERGEGLDVISVRGPTGNHSILNGVVRGPRNKVVVFVKWTDLGLCCKGVPGDPGVTGELAKLKGLRFSDIQDASYTGTQADLAANGVPNVTIEVPRRDEGCLFQLMRVLMDAVAVKGKLQGLHVTLAGEPDPCFEPTYQQDGVEGYKNQMRKVVEELQQEGETDEGECCEKD